MRILMFTNTYLPHVGGVARAVHTSASDLRARGHEVRIIAPEYPDAARDANVIRVPAIQNWNGSGFSMSLPLPGLLDDLMKEFLPDLIHSNHPFLLGNTAIRVAAERGLPLVFTHHTLYEHYLHYMAEDSPALRRAARDLSREYCNLCDGILAPSESLARLLRRRGVVKPITVAPTGVDAIPPGGGNRLQARARLQLPAGSFVVGHVGRLAREKNLRFLAKAVAAYLKRDSSAWFLVAGAGPEEQMMRRIFTLSGAPDRVRFPGVQSGGELADIYAAMDVFAFASRSETQGLVLAEAMSAGIPVVALDAPGVREVVRDEWNGRKLQSAGVETFVAGLEWIRKVSPQTRSDLSLHAMETARGFSRKACLETLLAAYAAALSVYPEKAPARHNTWPAVLRRIQAEWKLFGIKAAALGELLIT